MTPRSRNLAGANSLLFTLLSKPVDPPRRFVSGQDRGPPWVAAAHYITMDGLAIWTGAGTEAILRGRELLTI